MHVGDLVFIVCLFVGLAAITAWILRAYAMETISWPYLAVVYACWFLGFAGTLLLPLDMVDSHHRATSSAMEGLWYFVFWTTFVLAWVVTPLMMEYWAAGDFDPKHRFRTSLRVNLKFYLALLVVFAVIIVAILVGKHFSLSKLVAYLIAAANSWGLLLIVMLLGYGVVDVPRSLWQRSKPEEELNKLRFRFATRRNPPQPASPPRPAALTRAHPPIGRFSATNVENEKHDTGVELEEVVGEVAAVDEAVRRDFSHDADLQRCMDTVRAKVPLDMAANMSAPATPEPGSTTDMQQVRCRTAEPDLGARPSPPRAPSRTHTAPILAPAEAPGRRDPRGTPRRAGASPLPLARQSARPPTRQRVLARRHRASVPP